MKQKKFFIYAFIFLLCFPGFLAAAERYCVKSSKLNVRSGPGTEYEVLWQAERFYPLNILKSDGKWALFRDFEGYQGWVYKPLLSKEKSVVVKVDTCNVRKGPGRRYPIIFTAEKGTPFIVKSQKNGWYHVRHSDGDSGWIKQNLLW